MFKLGVSIFGLECSSSPERFVLNSLRDDECLALSMHASRAQGSAHEFQATLGAPRPHWEFQGLGNIVQENGWTCAPTDIDSYPGARVNFSQILDTWSD